MTLVFYNGPVQNGDFTLATTPGKAVGIRIAEALNEILGVPPVPHLWNTVRLAGDLRHHRHTTTATDPLPRFALEAELIDAKYDNGRRPLAGTLTDADETVAELALVMIEQRLTSGALAIRPQDVLICTRCAHMTGAGACRSCGHGISRSRTVRHLVADRDPDLPVLGAGQIHASKRRQPAHLRGIADHVPGHLILSRTRAYGIGLGAFGLPGLVLDPRTGLHIAVLAAALRRGARTAVMTTTASAVANIAAYGQAFTEHEGLRLLYALHGHLPYGQRQPWPPTSAIPGHDQALFEGWFLPLMALKHKSGVPANQLPAMHTYFRRTVAARARGEADQNLVHAVRHQIVTGETGWIGNKNALATAIPVSLDPGHEAPGVSA